MPNPAPEQPTRRERHAALTAFLDRHSPEKSVAADCRKAAACFGCTDKEFSFVFFEEQDARAKFGQDNYVLVTVAGKPYFVAAWAIYDGEQQQRVLVELAYRLLFEPAVFNDCYVHSSGKILGNVVLGVDGVFAKRGGETRPRITEMPTLPEIADALRGIGYFEGTRSNADFIRHMQASLPK